MAVEKGLLVVVSGPSGAGKGTICGMLREKMPQLGYSVSATTRKPRVGEAEGSSYFFKTVENFKEMIAKDQLLEYAEVYGNYYGTPREFVMEQLDSGKDVLLEIDIQGALQVKKRFPEGIFVFVVPPSLEVLSERLHGRGTDTEEVIQKRLACTVDELGYAGEYDYVLVNHVAEAETAKLQNIIEAERSRSSRKQYLVDTIIAGK